MSETATSTASSEARQPLTREAIVAAALRFLDREGAEALSMRRLGSELGTGAMSLYNHVANKDDLLDAVVQLLWAEVSARTSVTGVWRSDIRSLAEAISQLAWAHPNAYPMMLDRGVLPAEATDVAAGLARSLRAAGFGDWTDHVVRTVLGYAAGYTMCEVAWYGDPAAAMPRPGEQPPAAGEGQRIVLECESPEQYAFGLEVLLVGLEQLLQQEHGDPAASVIEMRPARTCQAPEGEAN